MNSQLLEGVINSAIKYSRMSKVGFDKITTFQSSLQPNRGQELKEMRITPMDKKVAFGHVALRSAEEIKSMGMGEDL